MAQMLLINPAKRRSAKRRSNPGKKRSAAQRRSIANLIRINRGRKTASRSANPARRAYKRRKNPIRAHKRRARRSNPTPLRAYRRGRRRNPSLRMGSLFNIRSYFAPIKDAAIQGIGAVGFDVLHGYLQPMLPDVIRRKAGSLGLGDVFYSVATVAIGNLLSGVTKGYSRRAAIGALTVQFHEIARSLLPASVQVGRLGFVTSGRVVQGMTGRVNSNMAMQRGRVGGVGAYVGGPGQSPLLSGVGAYSGGPGQSPLLSGRRVQAVGR